MGINIGPFAAAAGADIGLNSSTKKNVGDYKVFKDYGLYTIRADSWYKALPYGFLWLTRECQDGKTNRHTFWLPISPHNISVHTHFATNVIATIGGVVEEHSPIKFYDITIAGTTGIAPKYPHMIGEPITDGKGNDSEQLKDMKAGRGSFEAFGLSLGGFMQGSVGAINQAIGQVTDVVEGFTGKKNPTGVNPWNTGYVAFHNFYRFLLAYKKDASGTAPNSDAMQQRKFSPLYFLNYKDNCRYKCVVKSFVLQRSAESPMLYNYNLQLRAYDMEDITKKTGDNIAKTLDFLGNLGLGTDKEPIQSVSIFNLMFSTAVNAMNAAAAVAGGISSLGG